MRHLDRGECDARMKAHEGPNVQGRVFHLPAPRSLHASRGHAVLVIRPLAIIQDRVQRSQVCWIGV